MFCLKSLNYYDNMIFVDCILFIVIYLIMITAGFEIHAVVMLAANS